ncbi:MAG: tetratricopeptide repeat-containing sulfotransferase family protein [Cognatishimia sp.]
MRRTAFTAQKGADLQLLQRLLNKGQFQQLYQRASRVQKRCPKNAIIYGFLGAACAGLGRIGQAIKLYKRGIALDAKNSMLHRDLGNLYFMMGQNSAAVLCFIAAQNEGASDAALKFQLGRALMGSNRLREALMQLGASLAAEPSNPLYAGTLAEAFEQAGLFEEAIKTYDIALKLSANNSDFQLSLARCYYNFGQPEKALEIAQSGLEADGTSEQFHSLKAAALGAMGEIQQANASHRDAIILGQPQGNHFYNFTLRHDMRTEPEIAGRMQEMLKHPQSQREAKYLHFAMAKLCEDNADFDQAYLHLCKGNALQKKYLGYDVEREIALFKKFQTEFSAARFNTQAMETQRPTQGPRPIFIVGMPRSGTTLVEAILGRHPDVTPCGETSAMLQSVVTCLPSQSVPNTEQASRLHQDYLQRLPLFAASTAFVTDKMPTNFRLIGHILTAIPNARIVHLQREPQAVCWSNFRTLFSSKGNGFSYDVRDLMTYFDAYQRLMEYWKTRFPSRIHNLDYERLVSAPEVEIRALLEHIGLPWHSACLSPEKGGHAIVTASQAQVRRKIYQGSSKAWMKYQSQAGEWLSKLTPAENAPEVISS